MRLIINKLVLISFVLMSFTIISVGKAEALQPRLLWQKTLPFKITAIIMAPQSGDVILYSWDARQIILFDQDGRKKIHWGPRVDRQPRALDISHDGNIIIYETSWTEDYVEKKRIGGWDKRIHYVTRNGKELWNKNFRGAATLSPDGKMVAIGPSAAEGADLTMLDSKGNLLWKYVSREASDIVFSSDSNYVLFLGDGGLTLLDKSGNLLWKKDEERAAITAGAAYIFTKKRVYDRQGNIVAEIQARDINISADGNKATYFYPDKVSLLSWPDRTVLKEYPFTFPGATDISRDGRYLVVAGKSPTSSSNLFIFDTVANASWEAKIEQNFYFLLSDDGKYLLVILINLNKLVFYQIY